MSVFCNPHNRWIAIVIAIVVATSVSSKCKAETFEGMNVKVSGKGPAMIFIPGLNSASEVFDSTCDGFKKTYTCHQLQLPGFAGQPALQNRDKEFLVTTRNSVEHYIHDKKLGKVVLVGHSLGGTLSLMIAIDAPDAVKRVVIVDALPFYAAIQNPALTADAMRPQAETMRNAMINQPIEEYNKAAASNAQAMTNDPARVPKLVNWMTTSDRNTTATAMYDMMTIDLRQSIKSIQQPILVLGAWAAYKQYGSTKDSTKAIYTAQYAQAKQVDIRMSETSYHFIPWDDSQWLIEQINDFLK